MPSPLTRRREAGFTLIELLVVLGIIGVMAAVSVPQILNYMQHFRIRGATSELATAIQQARMRAVTKSAQHGVVFAIGDPTPADANRTYWIHIEDDQGVVLPRTGFPETLNIAAPDTAQSTRFRLPTGVVFATAAQCTPAPPLGTAFNPTRTSIRFNRLGALCFPGVAPCATPPPAAGLSNFVENVNGGAAALVCLRDTRSGASRWVRVGRGGRVEAQP